MKKQAIIYTRYSPRPNAELCRSNEKQTERCKAYCDRKGYVVAGVFSDEAVSGATLDRPGLSDAIGQLEPGWILITDASDRLARDILIFLTIRQRIKETGATIEFADGSTQADTPEGELFSNILVAFSQFERSRIRLRTKTGLDRKRKNGERTTSQIPIGWKKDPDNPKRLVICEKEREAIKLMCLWRRTEGYSSRKIAACLNQAIGPCRGKPWSDRTIRKLIAKHACWADPTDGDPALEPTHP